jgi:hypothetical protein
VPRVPLDHVHEDPTDVALPLGVIAPAGHDVVERPFGYSGSCTDEVLESGNVMLLQGKDAGCNRVLPVSLFP